MFGRNRREARPPKHIHEFTGQNVGADLRRQVCVVCGRISINALPPTNLRSEVLEIKSGLFGNHPLTVQLAEAMEPVLRRPGFGERRTQR